ncbi:MAG: GEVED domain-containing protein, partial [Bacteroidota bacterium]
IYCASNATSTADEEILNVNVGSLNNSSVCGTLAPGASSISSEYSDYTLAVSAPTFVIGQTLPLSVQVGTCGGNYTNYTGIWIDYNQNGVWDAGEQVYASAAGTSGPHFETGTFTIPATATTGLTRMRVVTEESTAPSPCGTYTWGETEDYMVNIVVAGSPYFTLTPGGNNFNYCLFGNSSAPAAINIAGTNLTGAPGTITVNAPTGFVISTTSGGTYGASLTLPYTTANPSITIYAKFIPLAANTNYSGNLTITGGGTSIAAYLQGTSILQYCPSKSAYATYDQIQNVTLGNINNTSVGTSTYTDYTTTSVLTPTVAANIVQTVPTPLSITVNGPLYSSGTVFYCKAWIDYNQDGVFNDDASELIFSGSTTRSSATAATMFGNVTIPTTAMAGLTRMRIVYTYGYYGLPTPCWNYPASSYYGGETEDYSINVIQALPCYAPTNQPTAFVPNASYLYMSGSFTASPDADNYLIVRSTSPTLSAYPVDGTTYAQGSTLGNATVVGYQSSTSFVDNNLNYSTLYYYNIFAANSFCLNGPKYLTVNPLSASINTLTPANIHSVATGNWSDPNTWSTGTVPDFFSTVTIDSLYTVHLDIALDSCFNLVVNPGGVLDATSTIGVLNLQNGITNNGSINLYIDAANYGTLKFCGAYSAAYNGTGTNNLYKINLVKTFTGAATPYSPILDMNMSNLTIKGSTLDTIGFIHSVDNYGIIKWSGTYSLTTNLFDAPNYTIPTYGGHWLNNPNFIIRGQASDVQMSGFLKISQGTYNVGKDASYTMNLNVGSYFEMDGGFINSTGRIYNSTAGTFKMSNG